MRKYVIGFIVGAALAFSANVYAEDIESLIGKQIQGQTAIFLDGKPLDKAIIVDGKSYAPTRKIAEASGKEITFNEGGIYLDTPEAEATAVPESIYGSDIIPPAGAVPIVDNQAKLKSVNSKIAGLNAEKKMFKQQFLDRYPDMPADRIQKIQDRMVEIDAAIAALEAEKAALETK